MAKWLAPFWFVLAIEEQDSHMCTARSLLGWFENTLAALMNHTGVFPLCGVAAVYLLSSFSQGAREPGVL